MKLIQVHHQLVFPTPIWTVEYEEYESLNDALLAEMDSVDWAAEHARGGLEQTVEDRYREDTFITVALVPAVAQVIDAFLDNCHQIGRELGWDFGANELRMSGLWAHVTAPGKNTQLHHHFPDHLSFAYYVRAPSGCGNLRFVDDRKHRVLEPKSSKPNPVTGKRAEVEAKEGRMVIFPAWMNHLVDENRSGERRVSVSGNARLQPRLAPDAGAPQPHTR